MTLQHDAAWARGGRASDVPVTKGGSPNPLNEDPVMESAKERAIFEIVRFTKEGGPLTKKISLNADGSTTSDGSACIMPRGTADRIALANVDELASLVTGLRSDQALGLGALRSDLPDQVTVVTKNKQKQLNERADL